MPPYLAKAIYFRATFTTSGSHPELVTHNLQAAFRDFEQSTRGGHAPAWFKLGQDYKNVNDIAYARTYLSAYLLLIKRDQPQMTKALFWGPAQPGPDGSSSHY
jgi:hypothetical protein